jgi:hypothetical protein
MRRLLCLAAALALTACAPHEPRTQTITTEAPLPVIRDPLLRDALRELERADTGSPRVLALRGELASWLITQGEQRRALALLTRLPVPHDPPAPPMQAALHRALSAAWRDARRAALVHDTALAGCGLWASRAACQATLRAVAIIDAQRLLLQLAPDDHGVELILKRCSERGDHACAVTAAQAFSSPHRRFSALLALYDDRGAVHDAIAPDALRAQIARLPTARDAAWISLARAIVRVGDEAAIDALIHELRERVQRNAYTFDQLRYAPDQLIDRGLHAHAVRMLDALGASDERARQQRLHARIVLEPTRATLNALLQDAPISAQRSLLLSFAQRVASNDLTLAALALSFAHDDDAEIELDEARARVFVAATALRAGKPHKALLQETYATFPAETPQGAALRVEFARLTAQAPGGAQRLAQAERLIDPAWPPDRIAHLVGLLVAAHRQRGDTPRAEALLKRLISLLPSHPRAYDSSDVVYDEESVSGAIQATGHNGSPLDAVALLALPMAPRDQIIAARHLKYILDRKRDKPRDPAVLNALVQLIQTQREEAQYLRLLAVFTPWMLGTPQHAQLLRAPILNPQGDVRDDVIAIARELAAHGQLDALLDWAPRIMPADLRERVYLHALYLTPLTAPRYDALLDAASAWLRADPNNKRSLLHRPLAAAYAELGRCDEAAQTLEQTSDPSFPASDAIALLIAPCARAGHLDAAHRIAARLSIPDWRAEALIWLLRVRPALLLRSS